MGCLLLAALAKPLDGRVWWTGVLAVSAPTLILFVISRTAGLPGGADDIGAWAEPSGIASMVFEAVAIVAAACAFPLLSTARERVFTRRSPQRPRRAELARDYR